jgi:hypothetical protein
MNGTQCVCVCVGVCNNLLKISHEFTTTSEKNSFNDKLACFLFFRMEHVNLSRILCENWMQAKSQNLMLLVKSLFLDTCLIFVLFIFLLLWKRFIYMCVYVEVVVAPPFVYLDIVSHIIRSDIAVAAQNCWAEAQGAYTGEVRSFLDISFIFVSSFRTSIRSFFSFFLGFFVWLWTTCWLWWSQPVDVNRLWDWVGNFGSFWETSNIWRK